MFSDRAYPDFLLLGTTMTPCAAFRKESRMKFANATKLDRKSGGAQWTDLRLLFLIHEDATARN
jgi:hypothetical protein